MPRRPRPRGPRPANRRGAQPCPQGGEGLLMSHSSNRQEGTQVNHRQQRAKSTSEAKVGVLAVLSDLVRGKGRRAPSRRPRRLHAALTATLASLSPRTTAFRLVTATSVLVFFAVGVAPASALTTRQLQTQITSAAGAPFGNPEHNALTADSSDRLWATDPGARAVDRFSPAGTYEAQNTGAGAWGAGGVLGGLAFSAAAGEIFVADSDGDHLWGLEPATAALTGKDLTPLGAASDTIRVAADNSGGATGVNDYVSTGSTVLRIKASDGSADDFTAGPDALTNELTGPFTGTNAIAVAPDGDLYVAAESAVYEFEPSGELVREITEAPTQH